jgi:hypothetical protein
MNIYVDQAVAEMRIADLHREADLRRRAAAFSRSSLARSGGTSGRASRALASARRATAELITARVRPASTGPACCPA